MDYLAVVLPDGIFGHNAANAGSGVNIAVPADDGAGIADRIAADLHTTWRKGSGARI